VDLDLTTTTPPDLATVAAPDAGSRSVPTWAAPAIAGVFAVVFRLAWLEAAGIRFNSDEAVTIIMARRILHGSNYVWYIGQERMGTFEQYLAAPFVALLPAGPLAFHAAQLLLDGATSVLLFACARRMGLSTARSLAACAFWAIGPYTNVFYGTQSMGGYISSQAIGCAGLLIALRYAETRHPGRSALAFGFLCGLGLYINMVAGFLLIPAAVWIVGMRREIRRFLLLAPIGAVAGLSPVLYWAAAHGPGHGLLGFNTAGPPTTLAMRATNLVGRNLRAYVGVNYANERPSLGGIPWDLIVLAAVLALGAGVFRFRHDLKAITLLRSRSAAPIALGIWAVLFAVVPYVLAPRTGTDFQAMYLFSLFPVTAILLAAALPASRNAALAAGLALAVFLVGCLGVADRTALRHPTGFASPKLAPRDPSYGEDAAVARWLKEHRVRAFGAYYWLSIPVQVYVGEKGPIVFSVDAGAADRFPANRRAAMREMEIVLGAPLYQLTPMRRSLAALGAPDNEVRIGSITLFTGISPQVARRVDLHGPVTSSGS
jgi:hypothetical protein